MSEDYLPKIDFFGKTDLGIRRSNNEDDFIIKPEFAFCAVADGMGGASAGELASRIFIESSLQIFSDNAGKSELEIADSVKKTFRLANDKILKNVKKHPEYKGMGCTAELLAFSYYDMIIGHVGDSRSYILRKDNFKQLTRDHSLVQSQLDQGLITRDQARKHSMRHIVLRAVGVKETLEIDIIRGKAIPGDIFLLCSDGLTDMLEDSLIKEILSNQFSLPQKAERLIESANKAGGLDNITVILCEMMQ